MITSLFKNNLLSYLLVSILGTIIWGVAYFEVTLDVSVSLHFANQDYYFSKRSAILFSFFVTIIGAALLNYKLKKYLFSYEPTNLFLLFYVLVTSLAIHSSHIIEYSLVGLLLMFMVNYLFYFIENEKNENQVFNTSFVIGLLVFQNLFFAILVPLLLLNLGAVKRITIKELALIGVGFFLPTLFIILFSILAENIEILSSLFQLELIFPKIPWKFGLFFLSAIFISVKGYRLVVTKRSGIDINIIRLTKNMFVFFVAMSMITVLSLFFFPKEYVAIVFSIPLSIFLSDFFANSTYKFRELIFLIVILFPFLIRYIN